MVENTVTDTIDDATVAGLVTDKSSATRKALDAAYAIPTLTGEIGVTDTRYPVGDIRRYGGKAGSDVSTALANAVKSVKGVGGIVSFPEGVFNVSATLTLDGANYGIRGVGGTTLRRTAGCEIIITGSGIRIENLHINGNSQNGTGVLVYGNSNTIEDCEIESCLGHGIDIKGVDTEAQQNAVIHCSVHDNQQIGICQDTSTRNWIVGNHCLNNGLEGITCDSASYSRVLNNYCDWNCKTGGAGGISMDKVTGLVLVGNVILNSQNDCAGIKFNNEFGATYACIITENQCIGNTGIGIHGGPAYPTDGCIIANNACVNNAVKNTIIIDNGNSRPLNNLEG